VVIEINTLGKKHLKNKKMILPGKSSRNKVLKLHLTLLKNSNDDVASSN